VVHEATHALQDYQRIRLDPQTSEGAAYLAAWIARLVWGYPRLSGSAASVVTSHSYARRLAARVIDQGIYVIPVDDVRTLNSLVGTAVASSYVFNGL
jgi:hypothetical protein